jgi:hypothetical protein
MMSGLDIHYDLGPVEIRHAASEQRVTAGARSAQRLP